MKRTAYAVGQIKLSFVYKSKKEINIDELKLFSKIKDFSEVNDTGDQILQENELVPPSTYRNITVNLDHEGHLVLTKIKALLRSKVFSQTWCQVTEQTQVLGRSTFCKSVTPSHDRHKYRLLSQQTPSETLDTINLDSRIVIICL